MTQGRRALLGSGAAAFTAIAITLVLQVIVGYDAVRSFLPVVLFFGAVVGFLVWYFTVARDTEGALSPARAVRSAVLGGGLGAWSLVVFLRSNDRGNDWPLVAFALVGLLWCAGWIAWAARQRA